MWHIFWCKIFGKTFCNCGLLVVQKCVVHMDKFWKGMMLCGFWLVPYLFVLLALGATDQKLWNDVNACVEIIVQNRTAYIYRFWDIRRKSCLCLIHWFQVYSSLSVLYFVTYFRENDVVKNLNLVYQKGRNLHKRIYEVKKSPDQKTKIGWMSTRRFSHWYAVDFSAGMCGMALQNI